MFKNLKIGVRLAVVRRVVVGVAVVRIGFDPGGRVEDLCRPVGAVALVLARIERQSVAVDPAVAVAVLDAVRDAVVVRIGVRGIRHRAGDELGARVVEVVVRHAEAVIRHRVEERRIEVGDQVLEAVAIRVRIRVGVRRDRILPAGLEPVGQAVAVGIGAEVVGLAVEKADRVHHEILMDVELKLTAAQAKEKSKQHHIDDKEEFEEDWIDIECSPEAIMTLLTKMISPLPTGHLAAFAATGRALVAERDGEKAADEYMRKLSLGILENNDRINGIVRDYIRNNPEVLTHPTADQLNTIETQTKEYKEKNPTATEEEVFNFAQKLIDNRAKFNPDGFNPALLPEEQGLPDLDTALAKVGLTGQAQQMAKAA